MMSTFMPLLSAQQSVLYVVITLTDEDRAAKQSEVNLLMDEVERAQTRLLSLEREKVHFTNSSGHNLKRIQLVFDPIQ